MGFESIDQLGRSSEVERNPKMSILFFWLERGGGWGMSPLTSLRAHEELDGLQKSEFYFLVGMGVLFGLQSTSQTAPSMKVECNQ